LKVLNCPEHTKTINLMISKRVAITSALIGIACAGPGLLAQTAVNPAPAAPALRPAPPVRPAATENITQEQRNKMRELTEGMRNQSQEHADRQRQLRAELEVLIRAEPIDESAIRAKAVEMGKVEGELAVIRAKYMAELKKVLPEGSSQAAPAGVIPQSIQGPRPKGAPPVPANTPLRGQKKN